MNNLIGQNLGPYLILEQIGAGGMATVYKAYQPAVERDVAIKVIAAHFAQDEEFLKRFRREAKAVAQLEHAHILPVYDYGEAEGRPYLVMRYLEAGTLKDRMTQDQLSLSEINRIVGQVGSALDYAHRMGVIHRDVKPANILLDTEGNAYLTDFGLAKMIEASARLTGTGVGIGTPVYMSPEQGQATKVDSRTDVYSLGVMLYEMVTGRVPYEAETPLAVVLKHINEPLPLPRSVRPNLPEGIERVILRALAKEPGDRYQTAGEMVRALDGAVRAAEAEARTEPVIERTTPMPGAVHAAPQAKARRLRLPRWVGWAAGGAIALAAFFLILSRVPLRVQISGGQLEVVRVAEETPAATPTSQPAIIPTYTPEPVPAAGTPVPLEQGETLGYLNNDVCIFDSQGASTLTGLAETFANFNGLSWSPDGSRFVFSANRKDDAADPKNDLYIANRDGSNVTALARNPDSFLFFPAWSPNGEWIAFHDNSAVAIIRPDGTDENILVQGGNMCPQAVAWSPDSQRIAWLGELGFCETGESRDTWVINRDGSEMSTIFHSSEQELEDQVAWSPDGKSVAVLTTDGVTYLVDADCPDQPDGCDESSRTGIATFPDHWLHTYWPQWADETTIAPSINPTDQRGQLVSCDDDLCILTADGSSVPVGLSASYTQFSRYTWSPDGSQIAFSACLLGNEGYCEELYVADLHNGAVVRLPRQGENHHPLVPAWSPNGDWIAYHDSGALSVVRPDGTDHREIVPHPYCPTNIAWSPDSSRLAWFAHWCDEEETSPALLLSVNFDGSDMRLLWTRDDANPHGSDVAFSPDGTYLAVRFADGSVYQVDPGCKPGPDGCDESSRTGMDDFPEHWLHTYWPQWDGEEVVALTLADQARAFADPILAAITDQPPDFEDDFSDPASGWSQGAIVDPTGWEEGERGYVDGEYYIVAPPAKIRPQMPEQPMTCASGWPADLGALSDMVLEIEGRFVEAESGNRHVNFRYWDDPDTGVGGKHEVMFEPNGTVWIGKVDPEEGHQVLASMQGLPVRAGLETNRLQIVTVGPQIAVYVNGEPVLFFADPDFDERYQSGLVNLVACNSAGSPMEVHWDNLKIWDISGLELPAAEAPPAPAGDATLYGCQPGERLLYLNDFEGGEQSFGPWVAEEAPEGRIALHALGQGMFNVLHESDPVTETRIAFRVRPVGDGSWTIFFRVVDAPGPKYSLTGFNDWLELKLGTEDGSFPLASAGPLTPNRWSLVEIIWEDRYTLVVRIDGAEVIRHVLPEDLLLERGGSHLNLGQTNSEAWFDDIVVCGE